MMAGLRSSSSPGSSARTSPGRWAPLPPASSSRVAARRADATSCASAPRGPPSAWIAPVRFAGLPTTFTSIVLALRVIVRTLRFQSYRVTELAEAAVQPWKTREEAGDDAAVAGGRPPSPPRAVARGHRTADGQRRGGRADHVGRPYGSSPAPTPPARRRAFDRRETRHLLRLRSRVAEDTGGSSSGRTWETAGHGLGVCGDPTSGRP